MTNITIQQSITLSDTSFVTVRDAYLAFRSLLRNEQKQYRQNTQMFSLDNLIGVIKTDFSNDYNDHLVAKYS